MREVAALAGVSLKTVSRVVNSEPGVSPELTARVREAIRLLDYRPDTTASSLRRADRRTATIGLLLEDVANPFSSAVNRAIEDVARQRETLVFTGSSDGDPAREARYVRAFVSRRVDGLIAVPVAQDQQPLIAERQLGLPIVCVDRLSVSLAMDSVTVDNRSGAARAVRHLAAQGHRRIGFVGDMRTIWTAEERYLGYVEGLASCGLRLEPELVERDTAGVEPARVAVMTMLRLHAPPTAIFTAQNLLTQGCIRALRLLDLHHQVALIGFDDFPLADLLDPPVSVIAQNPILLGSTAAARLFERLDGDESPARHMSVPTQLIARGSGEIPPS
jgi:LacI family transcriptional regulator, galactose operon repressor